MAFGGLWALIVIFLFFFGVTCISATSYNLEFTAPLLVLPPIVLLADTKFALTLGFVVTFLVN